MAIIRGTAGDDDLPGTPQADAIYGFGGRDDLDGGAGKDRVFGGAGDDVLDSFGGRALQFGGAGADTLNAGRELTSSAVTAVDRSDLGRDADRDTFVAGLEVSDRGSFLFDFNVERVANFRPRDRLDLFVADDEGRLQAGDFIDSDGNGVVNDADRDARLVGGSLVIDADQLFARAYGRGIDFGEQHVILQQVASVGADQFL